MKEYVTSFLNRLRQMLTKVAVEQAEFLLLCQDFAAFPLSSSLM
jgi:hypothetical protein